MKQRKIKNEKAITLIALVITIIILLILAGITISSLTGSGLFENAKRAQRESEIASIKEQIQTDIFSVQVGNYGNISDESLKKILEKYGTINYEEDGVTIKGIITTKWEYEILLSEIFKGTTVKGEVLISDDSIFDKELEKLVSKLGKITITVEDILENKILEKLMNSKEVVEYILSNEQSINSIMSTDYGMECLGKSEYAAGRIMADEDLREIALDSMAFKNGLDSFAVKAITLNEDSEKIFCSSTGVGSGTTIYESWQAFDKDLSTSWLSNGNIENRRGNIGYIFDDDIIVYKIKLNNAYLGSVYRCKEFYIQGSETGEEDSYENLSDKLTATQTTDEQIFYTTTFIPSRYVRVNIQNIYKNSGTYGAGLAELQIYGIRVPAE